MKHTEKSIQEILNSVFSNHEYILHNAFVFPGTNESDWFGLSVPKGYAYEVEVKISRSDFKSDFKKPRHQKYLQALSEKKGFVPNVFYYAIPEGLVSESEVPEYAGLIYITEGGYRFIKKAPYIHREKLNLDRVLKEKFYHRYLKYRFDARKAIFEKDCFMKEFNRMKSLLKRYEKPKSPKRDWRQHELFKDTIKPKRLS